MTGPVLLGTWTPGSPDWHATRTRGIGGSEVAPIVGLSPFESRFSLWHRKAGNLPPVDDTPEMEWGRRLEPAIAQRWLDDHPDWTIDVHGGTWAHPDRPWQIATPDLLPVDPALGLLEVKTTAFSDGWGPDGSDEIPPHYRCQGLWYCDVLGRDHIWFAVLIGGNDYRTYRIDFDEGEAMVLRDAARSFLDTIDRNEQPGLDGSDATWQAVRDLHPDIDATEIELSTDLAAEFAAAKAATATAATAWNLARSRVATAMGTARRAIWNGIPIATRQARPNTDGTPGTPYVVAARQLPDPSDLTPFTPKETAA